MGADCTKEAVSVTVRPRASNNNDGSKPPAAATPQRRRSSAALPLSPSTPSTITTDSQLPLTTAAAVAATPLSASLNYSSNNTGRRTSNPTSKGFKAAQLARVVGQQQPPTTSNNNNNNNYNNTPTAAVARKVLKVHTFKELSSTANPLASRKPLLSSFQSVIDNASCQPIVMAMPAASPRRRLSSGRYSATESPSGSQSEAATPTSRGAGAHLQQIPVMRRTSSGGMSSMPRQLVLHPSSPKSVNWSEALVASGRTSRRSEERSVKFEKTAVRFAPSCPKKDDDKDHSCCSGLCYAINADLNSSVSGRHVDDDATEKEESSLHTRSSVPPLLLGTTVGGPLCPKHPATLSSADSSILKNSDAPALTSWLSPRETYMRQLLHDAAAATAMFTSLSAQNSHEMSQTTLLDSFDGDPAEDDRSDDTALMAAVAQRGGGGESRLLWSVGSRSDGATIPASSGVEAFATNQRGALLLSDDFIAGGGEGDEREAVTSSPMSYRELDLEHVRTGDAQLVLA